MKWQKIALLLIIALNAKAQHCPWDCTGLLLIKTPAPIETLYMMHADLVDENKKIIVDTIFGTGKPTYDTCKLLTYEDFMAYRTNKISLHHWYAYDTLYQFAKGLYIIKFNLCKYQGKKLFLHFFDRHTRGLREHYIEMPATCRISPHEFSSLINEGKTDDIWAFIGDKIINMDCDRWKLWDWECK